MRTSSRGHGPALVAAIALASPALASPAGAAPPSPAGAAEPDLARVGELVQEAQTRFETADYTAAIELWTQAYAALPEEPAYAGQRGVLVYQIAQACVEAYSLDPQVLYLRKAERLFTAYLATLDPGDGETVAEVQAMIADLQAKIADAVAAGAARDDEARPADEPAAQGPPPKELPQETGDAEAAEAPTGGRPGRPLVIAGSVLLGVGVAGLGIMSGGLGWGARIDDEGEAAVAAGEEDPAVYADLLRQGNAANRMALVAGVASAALEVGGAALLGVGLTKQRASRELVLGPLGLAGGGGLQARIRF